MNIEGDVQPSIPANRQRKISKRQKAKQRKEAFEILGRIVRALARDQANKDFEEECRKASAKR